MKKIVVLLILCAVSAGAKDIPDIQFRDSISAADTNAARADTVYSSWEYIEGALKLNFYHWLLPYSGVIDTNFTNDSFFVDYQLSMNKRIVIITDELDTFVTTDSGWAGNDALNADSLRGDYLRIRMIHRAPDPTVGDGNPFLNKVYGKILKIYFTMKK